MPIVHVGGAFQTDTQAAAATRQAQPPPRAEPLPNGPKAEALRARRTLPEQRLSHLSRLTRLVKLILLNDYRGTYGELSYHPPCLPLWASWCGPVPTDQEGGLCVTEDVLRHLASLAEPLRAELARIDADLGKLAEEQRRAAAARRRSQATPEEAAAQERDQRIIDFAI